MCLPFPIKWAGGHDFRITNTCPVDNFLAILVYAMSEPYPWFVTLLSQSTLTADLLLRRPRL